jgi:hypothetical protein
MRAILRAVAFLGLVLAALFALLALAAWPPGGLMFALPYILLLLAALLGGASVILLLLTRTPRRESPRT